MLALNHDRLRDFVASVAQIVEREDGEVATVAAVTPLLKNLIAHDDWLPGYFARPGATYRQYLLHCDSRARFSVVALVWGPGQSTPVHNHRVWGLVGVLRGAETVERFARDAAGVLQMLGSAVLRAGEVDAVGPLAGDVHRVSDAFADAVSISIHVYGGDLGAIERGTYDAAGVEKRFVSVYSNDFLPNIWKRVADRPARVTAQDVRNALLLGTEIALLDVREEDAFAQGHPLFAAQIPWHRIETEALWRLPRQDVKLVVYDDGEGFAENAAAKLSGLGFSDVALLEDGLQGWRDAGFEIFQDVNSYAKAFGELVESRRHTPSLQAEDVQKLIDAKADIVILDARRFDEYHTMSIPGGISVPGAELVATAPLLAPKPETTIIVNCAGRTRSLIGTQSLINAALPNKIFALRNGTIGWTLAGQALDSGQDRTLPEVGAQDFAQARERARSVADRAGVKRLRGEEFLTLKNDVSRTLYCFDVRQPAAFQYGHIAGFRNAPGGQLVQETDHFAPVRGSRIVLADDELVRAEMTASWLAQMGWDVFVLEDGFAGPLVQGGDDAPPARGPEGRYKRPYEGTENKTAAMQAYLGWEYGLVAQLTRDGTHGFFVI